MTTAAYHKSFQSCIGAGDVDHRAYTTTINDRPVLPDECQRLVDEQRSVINAAINEDGSARGGLGNGRGQIIGGDAFRRGSRNTRSGCQQPHDKQS